MHMSNKTFIRTALISIAVAATAASLFTVSGAMDASKASRETSSGKLAVVCGIAYDKKVFLELNDVFSKQATALNRLGLGSTKADVCAEVTNVANAKKENKINGIDYGNIAYNARAVLGAAVLYRSSLSGATLDKAALKDIGGAFDVTGKALAAWVPGKATPATIKEKGLSFIVENLALSSKSDMDLTDSKNEPFIDYVKSLNISSF